MSASTGTFKGRGLPAQPLRLPRVSFAPVASPINQAFSQLEAADANNVKLGQEIVTNALYLTASDGSTWKLWMDRPGIVRVDQVVRT